MTATLTVTASGPVRMRSGETTAVAVEIRNDADTPVDVVVQAVGLDYAWTGRAARCVALPPGSTAVAELSVTVPAGSPAGTFPFVIAAQPLHTVSGAALGDVVEVDASVVVGDAANLGLQLVPREPRAVRRRRFHVLLDNRTGQDLQLTLAGQTSRGLFLRIRHASIDVPDNESARVAVSGIVQRKLLGLPRRLPFVITAQGHTTPVRLDGVFVARPLLGTAATRVIAVLAILGMWGAITFLAVGKISQLAHHRTTASVTQVGGTNGGTGSGSDAGGGGDGGASGTPAQPASLVTAGRINGVVTGPAPAGVHVTLQPTSLVDEAAEGATFVGAASATPARSDGKIPASLIRYEAPHALGSTRTTVTQSDGTWAFAAVSSQGYYLLTFAKAGFQTRRYVISQVAGAPLDPLTVPLSAGTGHLTGLVTAGAAPAGGAKVVITDGTVTVATTTPTKGTPGRWRVDGLSTPGTYLVSASAPGTATSSRLVTLTAGGSQEHVDLSLARGVGSLVGHVDATTDTGTVVDAGGVTVSVTDGTTERHVTTISRSGDGGAAQPVGSFTMSDLPLGKYAVTLSADGYAPRTQRVVIDGSRPAVQIQGHLSPSGATVGGTITDSASHDGIVGAGLVLTGSTGTYKLTSADGGQYAVTGVAPGSYVLSVEKFGYTTSFNAVEAKAGEPATVDVAMDKILDTGVPATSHIRGRVVDARNGGAIRCPVATPACITVSTVDQRDPGPDFTPSVPVLPTAEYVLPESTQGGGGLRPGLHTVHAEAPGYEATTIQVQVPVGGFANAPLIALQPDVGITGKITPGAPAPLPSTCVIAAPYDGKTIPTVTGCTPVAATSTDPATCTAVPPQPTGGCAVVDASGNYSVTGLPHSGSYYVFVVPNDKAQEWVAVPGVPLTLSPGETKRYDATMTRKGRIHLLLRIPTSGNGLQSPSAPTTVTAFALDPVSLTPASTPAATVQTTAAQLGEVLIAGLADGKYLVRAAGQPIAGSTTAYAGTISVAETGANQTAEATVVMTVVQPNVVTGRVVWTEDSSVFGVSGATVQVNGVTGYSGTSQVPGQVTLTTDSNGCFAVTPDGTSPTTLPTGCPTALAGSAVKAMRLITPDITVNADATAQGFGTKVVTTDTSVPVVIGVGTPTLPFTGKLLIDGGAKSTNFSRAVVRVTTPAVGSGNIVIAPDSAGALQWKDDATGNVANHVHPGTYALTASVPGFDDVSGTLTCLLDATGHAADPAHPCDITMSLGSHITLSVDVTEADGTTPVNGATVTLAGGNVPTTTVTAAPGTSVVQFHDLSAVAGSFTLTARAAGYAHTGPTTVAALAAGVDRTESMSLSRLGVIRGVVYGAIGAQSVPLPGVSVTADDGSGHVFHGTSGGDGSYRISGTADVEGLPLDSTRTWTVTASAAAGSGYTAGALSTTTRSFPATALTVDADKTLAGVDLTMTASPVELDVTVDEDTSTTHLTNAVVTLTGPVGAPTTATVNASSVYPFTGLAPTVYTLQVSAPNHAPLTTTVGLQPGIPVTNVRVVLADRRNAIAVHVLGQTGTAAAAPLAGAIVTITGGSTPAAGTQLTTDSNGDGQLNGLDAATYSVTIDGPSTGPHYTSVTRTLTLAAGQLAAVEATLQAVLNQVTIHVVSATGDSMTGAQVSLVAAGSTAVSQAAQEADASGDTIFNQVVSGTYTVRTTGPAGHLPGAQAISVTGDSSFTVTVHEQRLDLTLTTSDGAQPTATVTVTPAGSTAPVVTEAVVADATAHPIYVPTGSYTVSATAPGYSSPSISPSGSTANLTLTKTQTGALHIDVRDGAAATTAVNASISVQGDSTTYSTGPAGTAVTVGGLSVGNHLVTARLTDGRSQTVTAAVSLDTTTPVTVTVPITATGAITATVLQGTAPLQGATVTVSGHAAADTTDSSGHATFAGLAPGDYTVTAADSSGVTRTAAVTVTAGTTAPVTLTFPADPASLAIHVRDGSNNAVPSATVALSGPDGPTTGLTNATGDVTFTELGPGSYTASVTNSDGLQGTGGPITLNAGDTKTLTVTAAYTGSIVVKLNKSGGPVSNGHVDVLTGLTTASCNTGAGSDTCTLTGLGAGTYTLRGTSGALAGTGTTTIDANTPGSLTINIA